jgi:hypothetical protein
MSGAFPDRSAQRTKKPLLVAHLRVAYFKRCVKRRHIFETGNKPHPFQGSAPSRRAWQSFPSNQKRENPILVAERFQAQLRLPSFSTYAQVADYFGVGRVMVAYHIALLVRLPADFVDWLRGCEDPTVLRHFTERRLRPLTRVRSQDEQVAILERMKKRVKAG